MSTRHIAAEHVRLSDLTPQGSSGQASKRFRQKLAADGFTVDKGFKLKPGYLYTVVRAISARVNQNYDGWPSDELKKSYKTFIGKPVFVNHENHDPTKARGVVVAARYVENGPDRYIEVVQEVDAERFPKLAHEIKTGGLDSVSMGAEAGFTICSYCHNKATDTDDMCDHVLNHKGKTLTRFDRRTGKKEDVLVFESCHKISFFELSYVFEPADETAVASKVVVAGKHVPDPGEDSDFDNRFSEFQKWMSNEYQLSPERVEAIAQNSHPGGKYEQHGHINEYIREFMNDPRIRGAGKRAGKYTKEDFAAAGGKKPWEAETAADDEAVADEIEIHAMFHTAGGICLPGQPCMSRIPQGEQITKDSPNNPVNQKSSDPNGTGGRGGGGAAGGAGGGGGYQGNGKSGRDGLNPAVRDFYDQMAKDHADLSLGGYNPTVDQSWDEHHTGDAMDVMVSDLERGNSIRDLALQNPNTRHVIWQQKTWLPGGGIQDMPDRGNPTENHYDHVHINIATPSDYKSAVAPAAPTAQPAATAPATGVAPAQREARLQTAELSPEELASNARHTSITTTLGTYRKAHGAMDAAGAPRDGDFIDFGSGKAGVMIAPEIGHKTFEPYKNDGYDPDYEDAREIPPGVHKRLTSLNVLNVMNSEERGKTIGAFGEAMAPGAHGVVSVRKWKGDVEKHAPHPAYLDKQPDPVKEPNSIITGGAGPARWQHGYASSGELVNELQHHLGEGYDVRHLPGVGSGYAAYIIKHPEAAPATTARKVRSAALKKIARSRAQRLAWGEVEAPMSVDTLREEGTAPEDDDDDFERYVEPPKDLQTPDLAEAGQVDREQEMAGASPDQMGGVPGPAEQPAPGVPQAPQQQYMTLQIPMPSEAPQVPQQAAPPVAAPMPPQDPAMQQQGPPQQIAASLLDYFDNYYGRRVANWLDAIEAGRDLNPAEAADYRRQAEKLSTLENGRDLSTTNRNPTKGTATMARSTIASRSTVARAGRRQHFAEGPLVDGGERGRNDQGEQEEAFISQTPPAVAGDYPDEDTTDISNTEHNLVARVQRGRDQLLRDAQQLASLRQRRAFDEAGGPTATVVDPKVLTGPEGEALTGDNFVSADPNDGVVPTNPKDASLRAFQAFDSWLAQKTGSSSRRHSEATIKKAAAQFSREAGISPQALFPALGIVLREARKNDKQANLKGAKMRKRSNESLDVAAPDGRIDVEAPVENVTSAEAQASQFDTRAFGGNAGDDVAKPDLSTDQNWAPGEASGKKASIKTAGGLLAMRCAEGMIAAGLEPNSRERKYQLAAEFENMNRGLIQDRVALLERFAAVRQADLRRVASGSSRGAARSPIPAGLGGGTRTAAAGPRLAAHDPSNDSSLFI